MSFQPRPAAIDAFMAARIPLTWPEYEAVHAVSKWRRALDRLIFGELPPPVLRGAHRDFVFGDG